MRFVAIAVVLASLGVVPGRGQSAGPPPAPTSEQMVLSDIEVRRLVTLLRVEPGITIADVGAGLGAWSLRLAQWTGASGHVYATDIDDVALAPPTRRSCRPDAATSSCFEASFIT